ncbi:ABC transporter substrate-binding protein [Acrocarpospora macrocephala]|uniref:Sulfonate ABC transporter substrate-binding protein n=1 Tax=Acrocarpospora macrocephala TaxID=150177 RepID=A0A5M3WSP2_9ACTN|nr:ABC transporter substrate-binding protein [Acrocarpospora macrocephala]GES11516.1 sulfonate ABC transporter substrate-binding protein [Acrocarpospora macrocephala]
MRNTTQIRIALASTALLVAVATACGGDSGESPTAQGGGGAETVRVMMYPAQSYRLPVMIAQQQGLFEKRGITLDVAEQPANLQGMQGLSATKSDIGIVTVGTLGQGWQAGSKGAFFCGGIKVLQTTLMAPVGSTLPSTQDGATWQEVLKSLAGKKIGIQTPIGSGLQLIFAAALKEAGVTDVTYVNLGGGSSAAIAALGNGSVDVAQFNPTGTQFILNAKTGKPLLYMPEGPAAYKDYYGSAWVGTGDFLQQRPAAAKAFCEAVTEALRFVAEPANRQTALDTLVKDTGVEAPVAELVLDQTYGDFSTELDKARLTATFDAYVGLGILKADPKPTYESLVVIPQG